jgi:ADP-ribose pyrophosphatase YjhB (NUDIX family)
VLEETGVRCRILGLVDLHEAIGRVEGPDGTGPEGVSWHYVIAVHYGLWLEGEAVPASDCRATRFVPLGELGTLPLTAGAMPLILRAARLAGANG